MKITHKKGRKGEKRWWPKLIPTTKMEYDLTFTEESKYLFEGIEDQLDWRKCPGLKRKLFNPHHVTALVAWRYNPATNLFEITPYIHTDIDPVFIDNKYRIFGNKNGWGLKHDPIYVKQNQPVNIKIEFHERRLEVVIDGDAHTFPHKGFKRTRAFETRSWFGGTNAYADSDVSYLID